MSTGNFKNTNNFGLGILAAIPEGEERDDEFFYEGIESGVKTLNDKLAFLELKAESGYYEGVQYIIGYENYEGFLDADDIQEILNLDFRKPENKDRLEYQTGYDSAFYFRKAIKKDLQAIKKFLGNSKQRGILDRFGVVACFSNGETIYTKI